MSSVSSGKSGNADIVVPVAAEHDYDVVIGRGLLGHLPRMLEGVRSVTDPGLAGRISGFLADHPTEVGAQVVDQHLERMAVTVAAAARLSR